MTARPSTGVGSGNQTIRPAGSRSPGSATPGKFSRIVRAVLAFGTPSETHWTRLAELLCAAVVCVNVAGAWMTPEPVVRPVTLLCRPSATHCHQIGDGIRAEMEALG